MIKKIKMEDKKQLKILKIDLDIRYKKDAIKHIIGRLNYLHNFGFFELDKIRRIILIKKRTYGCRIELYEDLNDMKSVVLLQLIFGSDYRKEVNTLFNCLSLKMEYGNRLFTTKNYKDKRSKTKHIIKNGKEYDVTTKIKNEVFKRK